MIALAWMRAATVAPSARKLAKAIERGNARLEKPREFRHAAMREYAGRWAYGNSDTRKRIFNPIAWSVNTIVPHLATHYPKYTVEAKTLDNQIEAKMLDLALEEIDRQTKYRSIARDILKDALFGNMAIVRRGLRVGAEALPIDGEDFRIAQPYLYRVDLDDYTLDPAAKRREEAYFESHVYRVSRQSLLDSGLFDNAKIEALPLVGEDKGVDGSGDRAEDVSRESSIGREDAELRGLVEIREVALYEPSGTVMLLMSADPKTDEYLREYEWQGPEEGPYDTLEFFGLPSQPFGVPYISSPREQMELLVQVLDKLAEQIMRQKTVIVGPKAAQDDLDAIEKSRDGDQLAFDDPELVKAVTIGGVDGDLAPFADLLQNYANAGASNPEQLAGLQGGSKTATQYAGQQANAQTVLADMQETLDDFHDRQAAFKGWHLTTDPLIKLPLPYRLPGGETVQVEYSAEARRGDFNAYRFNIRRRSTQRLDPAVRSRRLMEFMQAIAQARMVEAQTGAAGMATAAARMLGEDLQIENAEELAGDQNLAMLNQAAMAGAPPRQTGQIPGGPPPAPTQSPQLTPIDAQRSALSPALVGGGV